MAYCHIHLGLEREALAMRAILLPSPVVATEAGTRVRRTSTCPPEELALSW
jgi:hypothetical protein